MDTKPENYTAMEDVMKNNTTEGKEKEIFFSKAIKAGKRIYYLDVKRSKKDELFLAITESKKIVSGTIDTPTVQFEKHKIFLYQEDFEKFVSGLNETLQFIKENSSFSIEEGTTESTDTAGYEIEI